MLPPLYCEIEQDRAVIIHLHIPDLSALRRQRFGQKDAFAGSFQQQPLTVFTFGELPMLAG